MTTPPEHLRGLLGAPGCTMAAPVFDPLSARVAALRGWRVAKLSGSVAKAAAFGLPDDVALTTMTDLVDLCRRITAMADVSLIVDADDGGGGPLAVRRTVREFEAAGVSAVEIEDDRAPTGYRSGHTRHADLIPLDEQIVTLRAAVAARRNPNTVIVARTNALKTFPLTEVTERIREYARAGADAIMLPGLPSDAGAARTVLDAVHASCERPLFVLGLPAEIVADPAYLDAVQVRVRFLPQLPYRMVLAALVDAYQRLADGRHLDVTPAKVASPELMATVTGRADLADWERDVARTS
jgi:oxaloacetate decarboxylase